ncbi:hypothetical protein BDZ89DRAFT_1159910 [Hymenopellis radicata]|nr:hypothetical protein BDZ89DRAFT_1159910 [Hymenopellis radicata]
MNSDLDLQFLRAGAFQDDSLDSLRRWTSSEDIATKLMLGNVVILRMEVDNGDGDGCPRRTGFLIQTKNHLDSDVTLRPYIGYCLAFGLDSLRKRGGGCAASRDATTILNLPLRGFCLVRTESSISSAYGGLAGPAFFLGKNISLTFPSNSESFAASRIIPTLFISLATGSTSRLRVCEHDDSRTPSALLGSRGFGFRMKQVN